MESHLTKRSILLVLVCIALAAAGCSRRHRIQIESDTCWTGKVNADQSFSDCGNATYRVIGTLRCVTVKRETSAGYVRVRIDDHPWAETQDQFGTVQACN